MHFRRRFEWHSDNGDMVFELNLWWPAVIAVVLVAVLAAIWIVRLTNG